MLTALGETAAPLRSSSALDADAEALAGCVLGLKQDIALHAEIG